jgi:predicted alpha/beta superfamily hydrolase
MLNFWPAWLIGLIVTAYTAIAPAHHATAEVRVVFKVQVVDVGSNSDVQPSELFVAGNLNALGGWQADGLRLTRSDDGCYRGEVSLPVDAEVEFKITAGSWGGVERDSQGRDIENRRFRVDASAGSAPQQIEVSVARLTAPQRRTSSVIGEVVLHERVESKFLPNPRHVSVWLPPGYGGSSDRYPVLYLHDGQNLFDAASAAFGNEWEADESTTRLIASNDIVPVILVGIWNTSQRIEEYTLSQDSALQRGGGGMAYIRFIANELKPFIDQTYRTQPEQAATWVGGSSLGGLISMHACLERPEVFGGCIALSPSLGWDDERLVRDLHTDRNWPADVSLWFSMGALEGRSAEAQTRNVGRARRLAKQLAAQDANAQVVYCEYSEGTHDENSWAKQFPEALRSQFRRLRAD